MNKILYVTTKWPKKTQSNDGGDSTIKEVIDALSTSCSLDLLCCRDDVDEKAFVNGINRVYVVGEDFANYNTYSDRKGEKFYKRIEQAYRVAHEIRKLACQYDIIIVQHVSLVLGLKDDTEIMKKVVMFPMFTATSYEKSGEYVPERYKVMEQDCISCVNKIITPSYVEREILIKKCSADARKIEVIPRATYFKYKERKMHHDKVQLVYIASVRLQKNHISALKVVKRLVDEGIDVKLMCVGAIQDKYIYNECVEYINDSGIENNVNFCGNLSHMQIGEILYESDINISVSNWETFGRGIYEGMSTGLPTIVFDKLECVLHSDIFDVCPIAVSNEEQMVEEIIRLISDNEYYVKESEKGKRIQDQLCLSTLQEQLKRAIIGSL